MVDGTNNSISNVGTDYLRNYSTFSSETTGTTQHSHARMLINPLEASRTGDFGRKIGGGMKAFLNACCFCSDQTGKEGEQNFEMTRFESFSTNSDDRFEQHLQSFERTSFELPPTKLLPDDRLSRGTSADLKLSVQGVVKAIDTIGRGTTGISDLNASDQIIAQYRFRVESLQDMLKTAQTELEKIDSSACSADGDHTDAKRKLLEDRVEIYKTCLKTLTKRLNQTSRPDTDAKRELLKGTVDFITCLSIFDGRMHELSSTDLKKLDQNAREYSEKDECLSETGWNVVLAWALESIDHPLETRAQSSSQADKLAKWMRDRPSADAIWMHFLQKQLSSNELDTKERANLLTFLLQNRSQGDRVAFKTVNELVDRYIRSAQTSVDSAPLLNPKQCNWLRHAKNVAKVVADMSRAVARLQYHDSKKNRPPEQNTVSFLEKKFETLLSEYTSMTDADARKAQTTAVYHALHALLVAKFNEQPRQSDGSDGSDGSNGSNGSISQVQKTRDAERKDLTRDLEKAFEEVKKLGDKLLITDLVDIARGCAGVPLAEEMFTKYIESALKTATLTNSAEKWLHYMTSLIHGCVTWTDDSYLDARELLDRHRSIADWLSTELEENVVKDVLDLPRHLVAMDTMRQWDAADKFMNHFPEGQMSDDAKSEWRGRAYLFLREGEGFDRLCSYTSDHNLDETTFKRIHAVLFGDGLTRDIAVRLKEARDKHQRDRVKEWYGSSSTLRFLTGGRHSTTNSDTP